MTTTEPRTIEPDEPIDIHTHFGLSYANYLVLHRSLMQSMPLEWQHRMTTCLNQLHDAFRHVEQPEAFIVKAGEEKEVESLSEYERSITGVSEVPWDGDEEDGDEWEPPTYYDERAREMEGWERVIVPTRDPVPHYDRGRTFIEPKLNADD